MARATLDKMIAGERRIARDGVVNIMFRVERVDFVVDRCSKAFIHRQDFCFRF